MAVHLVTWPVSATCLWLVEQLILGRLVLKPLEVLGLKQLWQPSFGWPCLDQLCCGLLSFKSKPLVELVEPKECHRYQHLEVLVFLFSAGLSVGLPVRLQPGLSWLADPP